METLLSFLGLAIAWVGHACLWTALLNNVYGRPFSKLVLKPWRYLTGLVIILFPVLPASLVSWDGGGASWNAVASAGAAEKVGWGYLALCMVMGGVVFPVITLQRLLRGKPACVVAESTRTVDLWPQLGEELVGNGKLSVLTRLPGNCVFRLDVADLTLALPGLPAEWEGLTILALSDLHFHGTPARVYFERMVEELLRFPTPDLVCLIGDFVDTESHHAWIAPVLGRFRAGAAKLAVLGNHDLHHDPDRVRAELREAGYEVLGNGWRELSLRGVPCLAVGHEGPWFRPGPDLADAPSGPFRLCLSHTPDNFYWGQENGIGLMLSGHVHGGGIRVPLVGPIFVPSIHGRRFDCGVFEENGTVLVVNRGVSGQEPIRFRCHPQVMRISVVPRRGGESRS
jgi:predicted MPP superfamily phosphohydrolase